MITLLLGLLALAAEPANLALHAPYTVSPAPTYAFCTDPGDATQLTDGAYSNGYFWTEPGTVGWQNAKPIVITLDLGQAQAISGVSFHTAAGAAGVAWPSSIGVYVADELAAFHYVGDLVSLSAADGLPAAEGYQVHQFQTTGLKTHGRYVAFALLNVPYAFCDEVEVYAGEAAWLAEPLPGAPVADVAQEVTRLQVAGSVRRRLFQDLQAIQKDLDQSRVPGEAQEAIGKELESLRVEVEAYAPAPDPAFKAILPLNDLHRRIFQAQAALWRAQGLEDVVVWQTPQWDYLPVTGKPSTEQPPEVAVHAMRGERRSGALNLSNAAAEDATVSISIEGMPEGQNPGYVKVYSVAWTDTTAGTPVAAALVDAPITDGAYSVSISSGMTRQVWLTVTPPDNLEGEYPGTIRVWAGDQQQELPLILHVYPIQFPAKPRLHFGGWDYTDQPGQYEVTPENRAALVKLLQENYVDTPWATSAVLPFGAYGSAGNLTVPPDTTYLDQWLELWPDAARYAVFPAVSPATLPYPPGSKEFVRAVGEWAQFWEAHLREKAKAPSQFLLLLVDEPSTPEPQALIAQWAQALETAGSGFQVWEDPIFDAPEQASPDLFAVCDVLCPNRQVFHSSSEEYRKLFLEGRPASCALEFYSCSGPIRLLDPYSYLRMQAWDCWRYGAEATYFWAFGDGAGTSSWNEYAAGRAAYTPLFLDDTTVVTGKHLEACREGIQDYETLALLRDALEAQPSGSSVWSGRVRTFLDTAPARVAAESISPGYTWREGIDRSLADQVRIQALQLLVGQP